MLKDATGSETPPATWDATEAARKALSCIYRFHQHGGFRAPRQFGAVHLIDVLRGTGPADVRALTLELALAAQGPGPQRLWGRLRGG